MSPEHAAILRDRFEREMSMRNKDTEAMLFKMKGECQEAVNLIVRALVRLETPDMKNLHDQWQSALCAVQTILEDYEADPSRDVSDVTHCVL
jgi:hypothetical protein